MSDRHECEIPQHLLDGIREATARAERAEERASRAVALNLRLVSDKQELEAACAELREALLAACTETNLPPPPSPENVAKIRTVLASSSGARFLALLSAAREVRKGGVPLCDCLDHDGPRCRFCKLAAADRVLKSRPGLTINQACDVIEAADRLALAAQRVLAEYEAGPFASGWDELRAALDSYRAVRK